LKQNGRGNLYTCDLDENAVLETKLMTMGLPVTVHQLLGIELIRMIEEPIDLAFIDSGSQEIRKEELEALKMSPNGIVLLHDARGFRYQQPTLFVATPRGLGIYTR
jgi:predicted O-methyltransferase YrrM